MKLMYASTRRKIWGNPDTCDVEQALYVCGDLEPHYPVPAIITHTEFFPTRVLMWVHAQRWYTLEWSYD